MKKVLLLSGLALVLGNAGAQIYPSNDTILCGPSINMYGAVAVTAGITQDDYYSALLPIGFSFDFYGNTYTQFVVSGNGYISFNTGYANAFSPWAIGNAIPNAGVPLNAIMAPWHDSHPGIGGTIRYGTIGVAPYRKLVVEFCNIPMYSCTGLIYTAQIILFETTNRIETHITNKPLCSTWNGGAGIHGIQNATGTIAHVVTGRNYPTQWMANNDGYEFVPTSATAYTINPIAYAPEVLGSSVSWNWNGVTSTGNPLTVTPGNTPDTVIGTVNLVNSCFGTGGTFTDTVIIYPNPMSPTLNVTPTSCASNTGSASVTVAGGLQPITYSWNTTPVSTTPAITNLDTGMYIVTVTDSAGCQFIDTAIVTFNTNLSIALDTVIPVSCFGLSTGSASTLVTGNVGTPTYLWNSNPVQTTSGATNLPAGYYWVTVIDADQCRDSMQVVITQPPPIFTNIIADNVTCFGGNDGTSAVYANGGTPTYAYQWTTNPPSSTQQITGLSAGIYIAQVTDSKGCVKFDTVTIAEPDPVLVTSTATDPTCYGGNDGSATVTGVTGGTPGYTYQWSTAPVQTGTTATGLTSGPYVIVVQDSEGCLGYDTVLVSEPDSLLLDLESTLSACGHDDGTATAIPGGGTLPFTFLWDNSQTGATATGLAPGTYTVTITDAQGCSKSGQVTIGEFLGVNADFSVNPQFGDAPLAVNINNLSTGASSYFWNFGDGTSDVTSLNPQHTYVTAGKFNITLTACYTNACCDSTTYAIEVVDQIIVPNVFTPNNDGENEIFRLNTSNLQALNMEIYNRWGKKVFHSTDVNASWDGNTAGGSICPEGTYYYTISVTKFSGVTERYNGTLTLLR